MQEISIEEKKQILLRMLEEIDEFCRHNGIRYSLAYGTLIGAIRHKGFIPWDDDVDIMMPLPDMMKFKAIFHSETMCYCDVDTNPKYQFPFPRIVNTQTYEKDGLISTTYGISIDLYPVLGLPDSLEEVQRFFTIARPELGRRLRIIRLRHRLLKCLPIKSIPGFNKAMKRYRDIVFKYPYEGTKYFFTYGGELDLRNVYSFDIFKEIIDVSFEGRKFMAVACFDECLRHFYGDYMQLPPEDKRVPYHGGHFYWRNEN